MSAERIVRRTLADRGKDRTDWERLRRMTEEEIERNAAEDPDNPPWTGCACGCEFPHAGFDPPI